MQLPDGSENEFIQFRFIYDNYLRDEILNYKKA